MRKTHIILALLTMLAVQPAFARYQDMSSSESKACKSIVHACLDAGFTQRGKTNKRFWQDCMKPIILGQNVQGVDIDSNTARACRMNKIAELKKDLKELQRARSSQ